jgi:predicted MFS family arabinose efflux permease
MYSQGYKRYVTSMLLLVYIFNQTDRAIFGFLMEPIKHELELSDSQLGFLAGPAMVLFYATLGIPIARWADRSSRVNIISGAVAFWSCIVVATAAVGSFWQFVVARVGVGVGEAGFTAIAQSLISDYHRPEERARALSFFMLGMTLGAVLSFLLGGWVNQTYGWRAAFVAAGLPGIVLALLVKWTIREPARAVSRSSAQEPADVPTLGAVFSALWRSHTLRHLAIAMGLSSTVSAGLLAWVATFFIRNHSLASGELGTWLAVITGVAGSAGIWAGGYLTSRYGAADEQIKTRLMATAAVLLVPAAAVMLWSASSTAALLWLLPVKLLMFFSYGPAFSIVQSLSATNTRATMAAVFILIQVLAGGVIGIQLLGTMSDALTPGAGGSGAALRLSMTMMSTLALWAAAHFWLAGWSIQREVRAMA